MKLRVVFVFSLFLIGSNCSLWQNLPIIPFGSPAGYYILQKDDSQKNGYDIGTGISTTQNANSDANENKGQFEYLNENEPINIKYSTGVEGILPEIHTIPGYPVYTANIHFDSGIKSQSSVEEEKEDENKNTDASYNFQYSTIDSSRNESSDANGNVQGEYKYRNNAGEHDLSYKAGAETGFTVTGGSLAIPNGLLGKQQEASIIVPDLSENVNKSITSADLSKNDSTTDHSETTSEEQDTSSKTDTVTDIPVTTTENPDNSNESTEENAEQTELNQENVSENNESSVSNGSDEGDTSSSSNESNNKNEQEQGYNNEAGENVAISNDGLISSQANLLTSTGSGLYTFSYPIEHKNLFHTDSKFLIGGDLIVSTDQSSSEAQSASQNDDSSTNEKDIKTLPLKVFVPFNDLSIIKLLPSSKTNCKEGYILG